MKTRINDKANKFGSSPKGIVFQYALEFAKNKADLKLFDFGCRDGDFLFAINELNNYDTLYGVDLDCNAINTAKCKVLEHQKGVLSFDCVKKNHTFPKVMLSRFDVITLIGVLEHVHDQMFLLDNLATLIKDDGILIVAVPGKHIFSFLDMGNWKFIFPKMHKFFTRFFMSETDYQYKYVKNEYGCIGDIEVEKSWHEHFNHSTMRFLLERSGTFEIFDWDGAGLFYRILANLQFFMPLFGKKLINAMMLLDYKWFNKGELVFVLRKKH